MTRGDPWTIGYGSTGPGITEGTVWTQEQADEALTTRVAALEVALPHDITAFPYLTPTRQDVLINMAYNIGLGGFSRFVHMISAIENGNWIEAADQMLNSDWADQVPNRAKRLSGWMESGSYT